MIFKMKELPDRLQALQQLAAKKLPPHPAAYRVARSLANLNHAIEAANEKHGEIVRKYGAPSADGKQITVLPENQKAFSAEMAPILDTTIDVRMMQIDISDLGKEAIEPVVLASLLGWFILDRTEIEPANT